MATQTPAQPVYQYVTAPAPGTVSQVGAPATVITTTTTTTNPNVATAAAAGQSTTDKAMAEAKKMTKEDIFLLCIAWCLPPAAVFGKKGLKPQFWIAVCLTICLWLPGMIYAYFVLLTNLGEPGAIKIVTMNPKGGKSDPMTDAITSKAVEEGTKYANSQGVPTAVTSAVSSNVTTH